MKDNKCLPICGYAKCCNIFKYLFYRRQEIDTIEADLGYSGVESISQKKSIITGINRGETPNLVVKLAIFIFDQDASEINYGKALF